MSPKVNTKGSTKKSGGVFTEGEKAAIRSRAQELKAEARGKKDKAEGERAALAAIAAMPAPYRALGQRIHTLIKASAPALSPKTWYGLPAYATQEGKVVCYLRMNPKPPYNDRYLTFGFNEAANLDEGALWPIAFGVKGLAAAEQAKIGKLVKKAVS